MSRTGIIYGVNGPVIYLKGNTGFKMSEMVHVGKEHLVGEVISLRKDATTIQVFEETSGLKPGETVTASGDAISVTLGPGILDNIFDGIQRPLSVIARQSGKYISRGMQVDSLDTEKLWDVHMTISPGMEVYGGTIIAEVPETPSILHKSMVPPNIQGTVKSVVPDGKYSITQTLAVLALSDGSEYELDRFQIADLEDEINQLELEVLTSDTHSMIDERRIRKELNSVDRQVKKEIAVRMRRNTAIGTGSVLLLIYMIGFFPYIFNSLRLGGSQLLASAALTVAAVILASSGGVIALFLLRRRLRERMEQFNALMRELVRKVDESAKKYEKYFSVLCTFMKAQSIYAGITKKSDAESARIKRLKAHREALTMSIERDRQLEAAFGIKRAADFEKNVTRFFDEEKKPADNRLYYYEADMNKTEIPLNTTGELVGTPYKFVAGLTIEREDIYEEGKGGD